MITLTASPRTETGKASRALISEGKMPATIYGPSHTAESVSVPLADFERILRDDGVAAVVEISGLGSPFQVLIHEVDRDPVTSTPRHADFYAIKKGAKVTVAVPILFVGDAPAAKAGANLVKVMQELEVEADPSKLPTEIEVNVEGLIEIGDQVRVQDIKLPAGVVATADGEEVVVLAQESKEEVEEDGAAPDMDAIEVEQKGKDDAEEETAGE